VKLVDELMFFNFLLKFLIPDTDKVFNAAGNLIYLISGSGRGDG